MTLKNSLKIVLIIGILLSLTNANAARSKERGAYATKNFVGQEHYLNRCSSCHGEGNRGGNMASIREWAELFSKNAEELKDLHIDDEESIGIVKYFEGKEFKNENDIMLKFLQEFAYDSEHIPTCN